LKVKGFYLLLDSTPYIAFLRLRFSIFGNLNI